MFVYNGTSDVILLLLSLLCLRECKNAFDIEEKYYLVTESYNMARNLFNEGRLQYDKLKDKSRHAVDTFLDLVHIMNEEMARELRTAIVKFYKIKYFHDFTNYAISMEEIIDISEHCLIEPLEKLKQIREHFHHVIKNFEDVRNFNTVDKCANELPDEVAAAHCVLHQAVLFNETMHESLATIVEIKMRQHAQDMNSSLYGVQKCLNDFVPKFFDQLLVDAYTPHCGFLKVVNASIADLAKVKWKRNETLFSQKWSPLVKVLKEKAKQAQSDPLFLTLFAANLTSNDIGLTLYK